MAAHETTSDDFAHLTALVRAHDRPRYYATLFVPAKYRADLFTLYAFAAEIARIPDLVSEAQLGEIRLQWWREALATAAYAAETGPSPTLRALAAMIARHRLPLAPFEALVEARSADLYSDPPATVGDLEGRLGETESALFQMAAIVMGADASETAAASGHAGVAYGLARRLAVLAIDRARGRSIVPAETLAKRMVASADVFATAPEIGVTEAVSDLVGVAEQHLGEAGRRIALLPATVQVAFLPLAIASPLLRRARAAKADILFSPVGLSDLRTLLSIGWSRFAGLHREA